eukprot:246711-Pelagomonas_calceolata.AAC.1
MLMKHKVANRRSYASTALLLRSMARANYTYQALTTASRIPVPCWRAACYDNFIHTFPPVPSKIHPSSSYAAAGRRSFSYLIAGPTTSPLNSTGKLETMKATSADVIGLDWATDIKTARNTLGESVRVQGNLDPMILFGPEEKIVEATNQLLLAAGPHGHILNVGHGVIQGTPEAAVGAFCEAARQSGSLFAKGGSVIRLVATLLFRVWGADWHELQD